MVDRGVPHGRTRCGPRRAVRDRRHRRVRATARARLPGRSRSAGAGGEALERHDDCARMRRADAEARRDGRVLELTGNLPLPGYTAPKIAWLASHEPDAYARTARMCLPHD